MPIRAEVETWRAPGSSRGGFFENWIVRASTHNLVKERVSARGAAESIDQLCQSGSWRLVATTIKKRIEQRRANRPRVNELIVVARPFQGRGAATANLT